MKTEFRKVLLPEELRSLTRFDRLAFPSDYFPPSEWHQFDTFWMLIEGRKVGCCAFKEQIDFQEDIREDRINPYLAGSLYVASTGILPSFHGKGFGNLLKCWEITYARSRGFTRVVTNTRRTNKAMIRLNQKFNFEIIRTTRRYYANPTEATVVMELLLP